MGVLMRRIACILTTCNTVQEQRKVTAALRLAEAAAADAKEELITVQAESNALRNQLGILRDSVAAAQDGRGKADSERVASEQVLSYA